MAEIVRVAMTGDIGPLKWPQRCPRCGASKELIYLDGRAARESASPGLGYWRFRREYFNIPILMCRDHAIANQIGGWLLARTMFLMMGRGFLYISIFTSLVLLSQFVTGQRSLVQFIHTTPGTIIGYLALGWVGGCALLWARRVAAVRAIRLDPDTDVAVLRFADADYARDFKKANSKATSSRLADPPFFLARASFWKTVLVLGLFAFIAYKTSH
jgi:hypothetical protein